MNGPAGGSGDRASPRDHLANERTLLAWIRTAITVIGLGFVVDRLALDNVSGFAEALGIGIVLIGSLVALIGAWTFLRTRADLADGVYRSSGPLHLVVTGLVVVAAIAVAVYLALAGPI